MCGGGSAKRAANAQLEAQKKEADRQRRAAEAQRLAQEQKERERQARIQSNIGSVNSSFDQFDDDFFSERGAEVSNFFNPQLDEQFADANRKLQLGLASRGLLDSSVAAGKFGDLQEKFDDGRRSIAERALARESSTRAEVERQRGNLIGQAQAGAGLESINSQLKGIQTNLSAPQTFDPLEQIFGDIALGFAGGALQAQENDRFKKLSGPSASGTSSTKSKIIGN